MTALSATGATTRAAARPARYPALDAARGVALVGMFVFHICWDLVFFGLAPTALLTDPRFHAFGHAIAGAFILLAGAGLALAARGGVDWRRALTRIGRILLAALAVTLVTYLLFPDAYIFFGILHLIAVAGLISLPLLLAPGWLVALAAAIAFALPFVVPARPIFDSDALLWLGLGDKVPVTNDWRPLLPWLGVMLAGMLVGRAVAARGLPFGLGVWRPRAWSGRALALGGRHSLLLYLTHQPVFIGVIFILATLVGPNAADDRVTFQTSCEQQCRATGGEPQLCARACGCIADQAQAQGLGHAVARNRLAGEDKKRFDAITQACVRREVPLGP